MHGVTIATIKFRISACHSLWNHISLNYYSCVYCLMFMYCIYVRGRPEITSLRVCLTRLTQRTPSTDHYLSLLDSPLFIQVVVFGMAKLLLDESKLKKGPAIKLILSITCCWWKKKVQDFLPFGNQLGLLGCHRNTAQTTCAVKGMASSLNEPTEV